jgi:hypothetical protein
MAARKPRVGGGQVRRVVECAHNAADVERDASRALLNLLAAAVRARPRAARSLRTAIILPASSLLAPV